MKSLTNYIIESTNNQVYFGRKFNRRKKHPFNLGEVVEEIKKSGVKEDWLDRLRFILDINDNQKIAFIESTYPFEKNKNTFADLEKVAKEHPDYKFMLPKDGSSDESGNTPVYQVVDVKVDKYGYVILSLMA